MISGSIRSLLFTICFFSLKVNSFTTRSQVEIKHSSIQERPGSAFTTNKLHHIFGNSGTRSTIRLFESSPALTDLLDTLDDKRNIPSLQNWAEEQGVHFAEGVLLVDNGLGDWGVGLSANHSHVANTPIMTIPPHLILSSKDDRISSAATQTLIGNIMEKSSPGMDHYLKECLLMMVVLLEKSKSDESKWSPWLETLPRSFQIGLSLDPLERTHVERMAPAFLEHQDKQWNACWQAIQHVVDDESVEVPTGLREYLLEYKNRGGDEEASSTFESETDERSLKELVEWAFGVVFTRSWRSPDGTAATLVPLGDMFNHDSDMANVAPNLLPEDLPMEDDDTTIFQKGSYQMKLKTNVEEGSPLFLSYGFGDQPARFLVNFGFWDRSANLMDANLTVPEEFRDDWAVDPSQLVVSTRSGAMSEELWNLGVYRFLLDQDANAAAKLAQARKEKDETRFQTMLDEYDIAGIMYLRKHALQIVSETYPDMDLCPEGNPSESPRRFGMIARYNNGMRESWMRVAESLEFELEDALAKRQK